MGNDRRTILLLRSIVSKLEKAKHPWEVDDDLMALWELADQGDVDSLALYGIAFLMQNKEWYDLDEGLIALSQAAEAGSAVGQFYLGRLLLEGREGLASDPILARYWIKQAKEQGYLPAILLWEEKWGCFPDIPAQ